jgi:hypothetical protein
MKTIRAKFKENGLPTVVKVFIQPDPPILIEDYKQKYLGKMPLRHDFLTL